MAAPDLCVTGRARAVLVVEDDDGVRAMLGSALEVFGLPGHLARSGEEAITLYREHAPALGVVLLDVGLPGMDGPQTLQALRALGATLPVVFMSTDTRDETVRRLLERGAVHFLPKPFESLRAVTRLLHRLAAER